MAVTLRTETTGGAPEDDGGFQKEDEDGMVMVTVPMRSIRARQVMVARGSVSCARQGRRRPTRPATRPQAAGEGDDQQQQQQQQEDEVLLSRFEEWKSRPAASIEAKAFSVAEGTTGRTLGASVAPLLTLGAGAFVAGYKGKPRKKENEGGYVLPVSLGGYEWGESQSVEAASKMNEPAKPIEIYEFQGCPFCRKVRVAVSVLGINVLFRPSPQGGERFRPEAVAMGGKSQFPFMVDPNPASGEVQMYESEDIIRYLFENYGPSEVRRGLRWRNGTLANGLGLMGRMGAGSRARPSLQPEKPLDLWGYEPSPFVVLVKEQLCELELPYVQRTCPRGSPKRQAVFEKKGKFQVPYLEDPNTGAELFESSAIVDYLNFVYGA